MLLMDAIVQAADRAVAEGLADHVAFREYMRLANLLRPQNNPEWQEPIPPRYVLDEKTIRTATELTLGRPKVQRDVLRHIRVPYSAMWVEWVDSGREELRRRFRQDERLDAIRPFPTRMGFFIEAEDGGRKGRISWAWDNKESPIDVPNVSGVMTEFDLDATYPIDYFEEHPLELAKLWKDNPVQHEALLGIFSTARHYETETTKALYSRDKFARALMYADVIGEYIIVWACLFLLTASRRAVEYREVEMGRLNKARLKAKKTPLLNHRTVHLYLGEDNRPKVLRNPLDYKRKSPHVHEVTSYIGHRKDKHWLVLPYWRGSGLPIPKTVHVHG